MNEENTVNSEDLIDEMYALLEKAWSLPLSHGRTVVETILRQAQKQANELIATTQKQTRDMRRASSEYVDDLMRRADESLSSNLTELRNTRQSLKAAASHAGKTHGKK
jgi:polyhydroxyalkanoate synthesis regulator phasin